MGIFQYYSTVLVWTELKCKKEQVFYLKRVQVYWIISVSALNSVYKPFSVSKMSARMQTTAAATPQIFLIRSN